MFACVSRTSVHTFVFPLVRATHTHAHARHTFRSQIKNWIVLSIRVDDSTAFFFCRARTELGTYSKHHTYDAVKTLFQTAARFCVHACMYVCMSVYIHAVTSNKYIYVCMHAHERGRRYIHIHTRTYTYIHIHTRTYTYIHVHTRTYTYQLS